MIKLDRETAKGLLPYLLGVVMSGRSFAQIARGIADWCGQERPLTPPQRQAAAIFLNTYGGETEPDVTVDEILEDLTGQLNNSMSVPSDGRLVEELVNIIQDNGARNRLGPKVLHKIRKALLLPHEQRAALDAMHKDIRCASCDKLFQDYELAVIRREPNERQETLQLSIVCTTCQTPVFTACSERGCEVPIRVDEMFRKFQKNCGGHKGERKVKENLPDYEELSRRHNPPEPGGLDEFPFRTAQAFPFGVVPASPTGRIPAPTAQDMTNAMRRAGQRAIPVARPRFTGEEPNR